MDRGWCRLRVAEVVCQNFTDELSFTFTVRWRGGKARAIFLRALTALASNELLRLCSTLGVVDPICVDLLSAPLRHCFSLAHTPFLTLIELPSSRQRNLL
jgi:hypothetical protein